MKTIWLLVGLVRINAGANDFRMNPEGDYQCRYPCRASVGSDVDSCPTYNKTWTCQYTYSGSCNYDTNCSNHGMTCRTDAPVQCGFQECPMEAQEAPYDGGCGCGCDSAAVQQPIWNIKDVPLDPAHPFSKEDIRGRLLVFCNWPSV